ncbi:MAG TPA: hypothetical protein VMF69_26925 [Gemmataceae bacterium]|nr:hypothetical protein [Gemmataceae bacterium]
MKYQQEIARISNCPPTDARPCQRRVFRFVHSVVDERSFVPVAKLDPARQFRNDHAYCSAHALSMFSIQDKAKARYAELLKRHKLIYKTLGTCLAAGNLIPEDGKATSPDGGGHFDFFEAAGANLCAKFEIVEVLHDEGT